VLIALCLNRFCLCQIGRALRIATGSLFLGQRLPFFVLTLPKHVLRFFDRLPPLRLRLFQVRDCLGFLLMITVGLEGPAVLCYQLFHFFYGRQRFGGIGFFEEGADVLRAYGFVIN